MYAASYLAPVHLSHRDGELQRSPGVSPELPWVPAPGIGCDWFAPFVHVQAGGKATKLWTPLELAEVPDGELSPETVTGVIGFRDRVVRVVGASEAPKKSKWAKLSVVVIPSAFWADYGEAYDPPGGAMVGEFFAADYRVRVRTRTVLDRPPPTWTRELG